MQLILNSCKSQLLFAGKNLKTLNFYSSQLFSQEKKNPYTTSLDFEKEHDKHRLAHASYTEEQVKGVKVTHKPCEGLGDWFAYGFIKTIRTTFDAITGYKKYFPWQSEVVSEQGWINRFIFLETVAGVPGFVGGALRQLKALRLMRRDNGWIHTLLEEGENERMHLLTFLTIKKPKIVFRTMVWLTQMGFTGLYTLMYFTMPRVCHRAVGYLEEEAVKTYTHALEQIEKENTPLSHWKKMPAPAVAITYWRLKEDATMLDVVLAIRKDEEHHREVNHKFGDDYTQKQCNPFPPGY